MENMNTDVRVKRVKGSRFVQSTRCKNGWYQLVRVDEPYGLANSLPISFVLLLVYSEKRPLTLLSTSSHQLVRNLPTNLNFFNLRKMIAIWLSKKTKVRYDYDTNQLISLFIYVVHRHGVSE